MSTPSSLVRMGLIGCGDIATTGHLPALQRSSDVELIAVVDANTSRAQAVADRHGCTLARSLDELVALGVHTVVIATPPHVTPDLPRVTIAAGLDVLCEKPMAVTVAAALEVEQATRASDRIVQIGFKNRFSPLVPAVRDWIERGELGGQIAFTLGVFDEVLDPGDPEHEERIRGFLSTAPSFVHEGAHLADHLAFLTGPEPVAVSAVGLRSRSDFAGEDFVSAAVRYGNGDVGRLETGWLFPTNPVGEFRALGPEGVALVDRTGGVATLFRRDRTEEVRLDRPWNDVCFDYQLEHFVSCVRARTEPETSVAAGVASLRLARWIVEALREPAEQTR